MPVIYDPVGLGRGFAGGVCIGLVSTSLMYCAGKVLGVSGILGGLVRAVRIYPREDPPYWQLAFVSGMLGAGGILLAVSPPSAVFGAPVGQHWAVPLVGGALVGFGTRLGAGCTSGHGVSGLPRLSPRSLVNVLCFMGAGALAAGLSRAPFAYSALYAAADSAAAWDLKALFVVPLVATVCAVLLLQSLAGGPGGGSSSSSGGLAATAAGAPAPTPTPTPAASAPAPAASTAPPSSLPSALAMGLVALHGAAFGLALGLSGMTDPLKVLRFLDFSGSEGWDPQLMLVMGGAVAVNAFTYRYLALGLPEGRPLLAGALGGSAAASAAAASTTFAKLVPYGPAAPGNVRITPELVVGGLLFGSGWGLGGVCPGPAIVDFVSGASHFGVTVPAILGGMALHEVGQAWGLWSKPSSASASCGSKEGSACARSAVDSSAALLKSKD
jgi:uncharacterized membrane protein YedE/YeeE